MFEYLPYIATALVVIGLVGQALTRVRVQRPQREGYDSTVVLSDWSLTGRIDFGCPDEGGENEQNLFHLRLEEVRTLESASGTKRTQFRWRNPTLAETKHVATSYNEPTVWQAARPPSSLQPASLVPEPDLFDDDDDPMRGRWDGGLVN